jgi:hypothetical protein
MSFSHVQKAFIVEHYLASRSYLFGKNEFSYPLVPNISTIFRLVDRFLDARGAQDRNSSVASNMRKRVNACIAERDEYFQHLTKYVIFF